MGVDGTAASDDGGSLEAQAVIYDSFPEGAASNLGIQLSRVDIATFGKQEFAFFISRGGSFLAIYELPEGPEQDERVEMKRLAAHTAKGATCIGIPT